jgi:hypothetical protein
MAFGYSRKYDHRFRRYRIIHPIPAQTMTVKRMEDGDFG